MSIGVIDTIALCIMIFSILFALYRGLVSELLGISSWILACFGAVYSYTPMQSIMGKAIENEKLAGLCGSVLVALGVLVIMTLINAHINQKLRQSSLSGLDRTLGMIFGILRAVLLMALLYMGAVVALSEPALRDMEKENVSMAYIRQTAEFLKKFVPQNVQNDLGIGEEDEKKETKKIGTDLKRDHKLPEKSHQKALKNLVEEIKEKPSTSSNKTADQPKKAETPQPKKEAEKSEKPAPSVLPAPSAASAPQYNLKERESLDNMVEQIMEKGNQK